MLSVKGLRKQYMGGTLAIEDLTFEIRRGELVCIVGPSGCGKTTLLKCISGLLEPTAGELRFDGEIITGPPPKLAVVFQEYSRSLYPWMTVAANVEFPLRHQGRDKEERRNVVRESLEAVKLGGFADYYPWQLSGGMQQRVACARALAYEPELLLMDEPFASVDAQTRAELEDMILEVWARFGITIVFVTHDIDESVYLSDRTIVLTSRPTSVKTAVEVDLARPRHQLETKADPRFAELRTTVHEHIIKSAPARDNAAPDPS